MAMTLKQLNRSLYGTAFHLYEAGKQLSNIEEFREEALRLFSMADELTQIIEPEPEKVSEEKMLSILDEILGDTE